jgi:hypothetical protein
LNAAGSAQGNLVADEHDCANPHCTWTGCDG